MVRQVAPGSISKSTMSFMFLVYWRPSLSTPHASPPCSNPDSCAVPGVSRPLGVPDNFATPPDEVLYC